MNQATNNTIYGLDVKTTIDNTTFLILNIAFEHFFKHCHATATVTTAMNCTTSLMGSGRQSLMAVLMSLRLAHYI